ncbi:replication factor A protein 2 [Allomyces arbusculus]|nr:replication factor A protein 2 [Allomyces arbusculus]
MNSGFGYGGGSATYGGYGGASTSTQGGGYGGLSGGGGFSLSQAGGGGTDLSSTQGGGNSRPKRDQRVRAVTLKCLAQAVQSGDGPLTLHGQELSLVSLVAKVEAVTEVATNVTLRISDGSGDGDVRMYLNAAADAAAAAAAASGQGDGKPRAIAGVDEGTYVKIVGNPKTWNGKRYIIAQTIRPVVDFNEVSLHLINVVAHFLLATRGPPPRANATVPPQQQSQGAFAGYGTQQQQQQFGGAQQSYGAQQQFGVPQFGGTQLNGAPHQQYGTQQFGAPQQQHYGGAPQQQYGGYGGNAGFQQQPPQQQQYGGFAGNRFGGGSMGGAIGMGGGRPPVAAPVAGPDYGHPIRNAMASILARPDQTSQVDGTHKTYLYAETSKLLGYTVPAQELEPHFDWLLVEGHAYATVDDDHIKSTSA